MRTEKCMLAMAGDETQIDKMIASKNWHYEIKYDGERCIIRNDGTNVFLNARSGKDIRGQFPELTEMAKNLPVGIYDGEIYVPKNSQNKDKPTTSGRTSVNDKDALLLAKVKPATFMCFDILEYEGENIENKTYEERKEKLAQVDSMKIDLFSGVFPEENPKETWEKIRAGGDEGMVAKKIRSPYCHSRSSNWVKLKTWQEEDFTVIGITSEKREISALVLDNGMKVNCSLDAASYSRLLSDLMKSDTVMKCSDGTVATKLKKTYTAKVKFLHKSGSGLRFPILHGLEGY